MDTHRRGRQAGGRPAAQAGLLCCALTAAALAAGVPAADAQAADPQGLVAQAGKLIEQGDAAQAEALLMQAVKAAPHVPAFLSLGELYEATARKEEALEVYGHVLSRIEPENRAARERVRRLFFEGRFPREAQLQYLSLGPVSFTVDRCLLSDDYAARPVASRRLAYTTSLLFPEELTRGRAAPWVRLPASSGVFANLMYNRVAYGMAADPGTEVMRTRWMAGWPSPTVLLSGTDYSDLAARLLHIILRGHVYLQEYLSLDRRPEGGGLLRMFLTEEGPTGAEQAGDAVFFYDVGYNRAPLEWLREAFHELGHLILPPVGPFGGDDPWGNGDLGERLLFQWLLEEAGMVAGGTWPGTAATETLDRLWDIGHIPAQAFLIDRCRIPLNAWLATPPESFTGEDAAERFVGFCLWVQAAHGRRAVAAVLHGANETSPGAFIDAYKAMVREALAEGDLWLDAGALNPVAAKLMQPVREGALRRELVVLGRGGHATYRVYLPAGRWTLTPVAAGAGDGGLRLVLDGTRELAVPAEGGVDLGEVGEGWRDVAVACDAAGPVELIGLRLHAVGD